MVMPYCVVLTGHYIPSNLKAYRSLFEILQACQKLASSLCICPVQTLIICIACHLACGPLDIACGKVLKIIELHAKTV